jgi:hypothetical protein
MGSKRKPNARVCRAASLLLACLCAAAILLTAASGVAEDVAPAAPRVSGDRPGFLAAAGQWLKEQAAHFSFGSVQGKIDHLGRGAGDVAKSTVEGAKDAAGAVARFPSTRLITGHVECATAANGAPDCLAAADALCKGKGFSSGKSIDMTTAEVCPPEVYLAGRSGGPECRTETFVSRAICQ